MGVGQIIRDRRKELGLSREEVAKMAGISKGYLKIIETEHVSPGIATIARIAGVLDLSLRNVMKD